MYKYVYLHVLHIYIHMHMVITSKINHFFSEKSTKPYTICKLAPGSDLDLF
jgi:hypothetical protein